MITDEYIAEAQRLSIAQNKTLKFFYQTWWAWWLPRTVIVGLMIFLYLINLGSTVVLLGVVLVFSFTGGVVGSPEFGQSAQKGPGQRHHHNCLDERAGG